MRKIIGCAILLAAMACAQDKKDKVNKGVNFYSREKEAAMGAQLAQEIRRQATLVESPAVNDYVNRIGARLAAQLVDPKFPYTFAVTADDQSNATHEPVSLPGGYIFVPASLILAANGEAEFAGMLAHAMSHVYTRDTTRDATRGQIASQSTIPLIFVGGAWAGYGARQILIPAGSLRFARERELDADADAVEMMSSAGFDPAELERYLGRIGAADPSKPESKALTFQTMPTTDERLEAIASKLGTLPAKPYESGDSAEFAKIQTEVRGVAPKGGVPGLRNLADAKRPKLKKD